MTTSRWSRFKPLGRLVDERQRGAIRAAAENIPGVKAVEDHLVWIDPVSGIAIHAF